MTMGARGRAHVVEDFDIRREAARLATLFEGPASDIRPSPHAALREDAA